MGTIQSTNSSIHSTRLHRYLNTEFEFEQRRQILRDETWLRSSEISLPFPLKNDLQQVVTPDIPSVENALKIISEFPKSLGFAMSGSGPSCFALFPDIQEAKKAFNASRGFDCMILAFPSWK